MPYEVFSLKIVSTVLFFKTLKDVDLCFTSRKLFKMYSLNFVQIHSFIRWCAETKNYNPTFCLDRMVPLCTINPFLIICRSTYWRFWLLSSNSVVLFGYFFLLKALWDSISVYIGPSPREREEEKRSDRWEKKMSLQPPPSRCYCKRNKPSPCYNPN